MTCTPQVQTKASVVGLAGVKVAAPGFSVAHAANLFEDEIDCHLSRSSTIENSISHDNCSVLGLMDEKRSDQESSNETGAHGFLSFPVRFFFSKDTLDISLFGNAIPVIS